MEISGEASRARSEGTANSGVPQKRMRNATAKLPLPGFFQFADFPFDKVALQHAEMLNKQHAIEMIDLMAESPRQQSFAAHFEFLAGSILRAHRHILRSHHVAAEARNREAAFFLALLAFHMNDVRIRANQFGLGILAQRYVNHRQPQRNANLRRGESHARGRIHGLKHIGDQLLQLLIKSFYRLAGRFQPRRAELHNWMNHLAITIRSRISVGQALLPVSAWSSDSPLLALEKKHSQERLCYLKPTSQN